MENKLEKKYNLWTAIAMVVGIVIGSGIFYKAEAILQKTQGNMPLGVLAWVIGAAVMIVCALAFSTMAGRYEKVNGLVDYAEATCGKVYAYFVAHFATCIYYPAMTSVLAWVSARYTVALYGLALNSAECMVLGAFYLVAIYGLNALAPKLAGKFQIATTVVKLIPRALMAVVGGVVGLANGQLAANMTHDAVVSSAGSSSPLFAAVVATAFAYEGWIIATTINAELKDAKKNLPIALVMGCGLIAVVYILYYIGLSGGASNAELLVDPTKPFVNIFGPVCGKIVEVLIVFSCLGTLNGLMFASVRSSYAIAVRKEGFRPKTLESVDKETNVPANSAVVGLLLCTAWYVYFYGANLTEGWFGPFNFDSSELPIINIYAFYIPMMLLFMKKATDLKAGKRFVLPALAICGSVFMVIAAIVAHGISSFYYLIVFAVIMALGAIPLLRKKK